jgi:hypothetical protein
MRSCGIDDFFYTPNNIFIIPVNPKNKAEILKLIVNVASIIGTNILYREGTMLK